MGKRTDDKPISVPDLEEVVLDAPADAGVRVRKTDDGDALDLEALEAVSGGAAERANIVQTYPGNEVVSGGTIRANIVQTFTGGGSGGG